MSRSQLRSNGIANLRQDTKCDGKQNRIRPCRLPHLMILLVIATAGSDDAGIAAAPAMTELVIARRVMCVAMIRGPPVASVMVRGRHGCTRGGLSVCALKVRWTRAAKCTPACRIHVA